MFSIDVVANELPCELLLDTSYVVEAVISTQPLHAPSLDFLVRLANEGVRVRLSSMLELELAEAAFQISLRERHRKHWRRFRYDGRARPRAARFAAEVARTWGTYVTQLRWTRITIDQVTAAVPSLMADHGLSSCDSVHAATALLQPPIGIVTTDVAFACLPEDTVVFTDTSRVARCREIRARRR